MLSANELYSTYDGGWLWKVNEFATQPFNKTFKWMYLFDHFDGIVLGSGKETLFITSNRGNTPVELSLFSALPFGNKVVLQWTTETETNNMGFEIERLNMVSGRKLHSQKDQVPRPIRFSTDMMTMNQKHRQSFITA